MLISLNEYGTQHGKSADTMRRMAEKGLFITAQKIGRNWIIDSQEEYPVKKRTAESGFAEPKITGKSHENLSELLNLVFEADCLEKMKDIPSNSIDMILCDLPYGMTQNAWDSFIPLDLLWKEYLRIIKTNGVIALTSHGLFTAKLIVSQEKFFKYKWVWEKSKPTNFLNAKKQPLRKHEDVCIFYQSQPTFHPQMTQGTAYDKGVRKNQLSGSYGDFEPVHVFSDGERYPTDIVYIKTAETEGAVLHPTQKPVELGRYFIRTYSNPGDVILDNTCGSGSFLVAALVEGRNFIGIEKNDNVALFKRDEIDYIDVTKARLHKAWITLPNNVRASLYKSALIESFCLEAYNGSFRSGK